MSPTSTQREPRNKEGRTVRRLLISLTLAGLALSTVGMPAAAATTRVVDGDGRASAGSCSSSAAAYSTIQSAIAASSAGDTVLVCPGTYVEQPIIRPAKDGLTLRSVVNRAAIIKTPATLDRDAIVTIRAGADEVSVIGFRLHHRATVGPFAAGVPECIVFAGIRVDGAEAVITGNSIVATGPGTLSGCVMAFGIAVGEGGAASATAERNVVKDFAADGIAVGTPGEQLVARRNIVRYHHRDAIDTDASVARSARMRWVRTSRPAGNPDSGSAGIIAFGDPRVRIFASQNTIEGSLPKAGPLSDGLRRHLELGIAILGGGGTITGNRVFRSENNIFTGEIDLDVAGSSVPGIVIDGNVAVSGEVGISVRGTGVTVSDNRVGGNGLGLAAFFDTFDNVFRDNTATGNDLDCLDVTGATAAEVDNTWQNNTADSDDPSGICVEVQP